MALRSMSVRGCASCRISILDAFLPAATRFVFTSRATASRPIQSHSGRAGLRRAFSSATAFRDTGRSPQTFEEVFSHPDAQEKTTSPKMKGEAAASSDPEVPWYLQEEAPRHPTLIQEPPPLPPLPPDPPRILEPLLAFSAEDLGLDELELLDLRALDPPVSLGPKLLMLFGTARSERHLHVCGGRLVAWLRTRGIRADADGLLGPNELKVKLRRKAKKAKLLGNSGLRADEDDGISTRWICVNLGTLNPGGSEMAKSNGDDLAFGAVEARQGTTIVVQIFTDSRRREMDLEMLWSRMLTRSLKNQAADRGEGDVEADAEPAESSSPFMGDPKSTDGRDAAQAV